MAKKKSLYTYRGGIKFPLRKRPGEIVVRALPQAVEQAGFGRGKQVSSASTRLKCDPKEVDHLMDNCRRFAVTHHAYDSEETGYEFLITDRILVRFEEPPTAETFGVFINDYSLINVEALSDSEYVLRLTDHTGCNPIKLIVQLTESDDRIAWAEHDLNVQAQATAFSLPTDPYYIAQWHLHIRRENPYFSQWASSRCEAAWQLLDGFGSPEVVVGISDDGCRMDHPDFSAEGKFAAWGYLRGERLVVHTDLDATIEDMYVEGSNHGTSCAGVIAADNDGQRTVGAAPGCRLLPIRWESEGPLLFISDSKFIRILNFIADKVDILSCSWGIVPLSLWSQGVRSRIEHLTRVGGRRGKGIVFMFAAGNDNAPIQHTSGQEIPYTTGWNGNFTQWVGVRTSKVFRNNLTDIEGVLHIAALASTAKRSHYSNYGEGIDLCAPSNNLHTYYRMPVPGLGVTTTTGKEGGVTGTFGGTSSATPLVAGIAALVISAHPDLSAHDVVSILRRTASRNLEFEGYPRTPAAEYDKNPDWDISPVEPFDSGAFQDRGDPDGTWSPWFGFGRVDAMEAVRVAQSLRIGDLLGVSYESRPDLNIPDADLTGVRDSVHVTREGMVRAVRVEVDVVHTWIGDLRIMLQHPDGTLATLHNRTGASTHNLSKTYKLEDAPELGLLLGKRAPGDWVLRVADEYPDDSGRLRRWKLELELVPVPMRHRSEQSVRIPDNSEEGVTQQLELPAGTIIRGVNVEVDISHPWIGDLRVTLTPPGRAAPIVLHDNEGGNQDNLRRTWRSIELETLAALHGGDAGGAWQLHVADTERYLAGKLNSWAVEVLV